MFLRLLDCRLGKALWHLLALSLLLSLMLAWGHSCLAAPQIRSVSARLFNEIGKLVFLSDEGVRTERNPNLKQSYRLDDQLRFDYYPGHSLSEGDIKNWTTPFGLIVMDNGMVFWAENYAESGQGRYLAAPFLLLRDPMRAETVKTGMTARSLYDYLKSNLEHKEHQRIHFMLPEADGKLVSEYLTACLGVMVFFGALSSIVLLTVLSILFFSVMQLVLFAGAEHRPSFRQILVLLIYMAFPALSAGALYSFFMFSAVSPQTVFFAVYFLYYMIIFRKVKLQMNPPQNSGKEDL